ncbi:hypothetical protein [Scytonema sp. NUACC21]
MTEQHEDFCPGGTGHDHLIGIALSALANVLAPILRAQIQRWLENHRSSRRQPKKPSDSRRN